MIDDNLEAYENAETVAKLDFSHLTEDDFADIQYDEEDGTPYGMVQGVPVAINTPQKFDAKSLIPDPMPQWLQRGMDPSQPIHREEGAVHTQSFYSNELGGEVLVPRVRLNDQGQPVVVDDPLSEAMRRGDYILVPGPPGAQTAAQATALSKYISSTLVNEARNKPDPGYDEVGRDIGRGLLTGQRDAGRAFQDTAAMVAGAPVDLMNEGLKYLGLGSDYPIGGSESIRDALASVVNFGNSLIPDEAIAAGESFAAEKPQSPLIQSIVNEITKFGVQAVSPAMYLRAFTVMTPFARGVAWGGIADFINAQPDEESAISELTKWIAGASEEERSAFANATLLVLERNDNDPAFINKARVALDGMVIGGTIEKGLEGIIKGAGFIVGAVKSGALRQAIVDAGAGADKRLGGMRDTLSANPIGAAGDLALSAAGKLAKGSEPPVFRLRAGGQDHDAAKTRIAEISGGNRVKIDHLGTYFDEDHVARHGRKLDPYNDDDFAVGVEEAVAEVRYQLTQAVSGKGWYDTDVATTFEIASKLPGLESLATNETHRIIWSAIAGASSNGQNVISNTRVSLALMRHYLKTGDLIIDAPPPDSTIAGIPKVGFGQRGTSVGKSLGIIKKLLNDLGEEGFADWWLSPRSLKEITEFRKAAGLKGAPGGVRGGAKSIHLGARAIGDKTGQFSLNINGYEGTTKDSWFTRSYNRVYGQMRRADGEIAMQPRNFAERERQEEYVRQIQARLQSEGLSEQDVQAVLWYGEQNLYTDLGVLSRPEGFSEGARLTNDATGLRPAVRGSDADQAAPEPGSTLENYREISGKQRTVRHQRRRRLEELNNGSVDAPSSQPYKRDSAEDDGRVRLVADAEVAARYEAANLKIPALTELDASQSGADYAQRMRQAMEPHKFGAQVELKTPEDLSGFKLYQTDSDAGFALKPDGDVVAVYSGANEPRGGIYSVLQAAIQSGGRKLDAFDTMLPDIYETVGFRPVALVKWNDTYAPKPPYAAKAWDKNTFAQFNNGEPDVVLMVYDPDYFGGVDRSTLPRFDDFDDAAKIQNAEVERLSPRVNEVHGTD